MISSQLYCGNSDQRDEGLKTVLWLFPPSKINSFHDVTIRIYRIFLILKRKTLLFLINLPHISPPFLEIDCRSYFLLMPSFWYFWALWQFFSDRGGLRCKITSCWQLLFSFKNRVATLRLWRQFYSTSNHSFITFSIKQHSRQNFTTSVGLWTWYMFTHPHLSYIFFLIPNLFLILIFKYLYFSNLVKRVIEVFKLNTLRFILIKNALSI